MDDLIDREMQEDKDRYNQVDEQVDIQRILFELSERERLIIVLHYYMNLTYREIAMQLNITEKCVSVTASRTLKKIQKKLNI